MKVFSLIFALVLVISPRLTGAYSEGEVESLIREGNTAFQEDNYITAIQIYEGLIAENYESGPLYYNLGNAYYREGNTAKAILCYEKALYWIPGDEDLVHNLGVARQMTVDQIEPVPRLFLWDYWDSFLSAFSIQALTILLYLGYIAILVCILLVSLTRNLKVRKCGLFAGAGLFLLLAISIFLLNTKVTRLTGREYGIVMPMIVEVKNSPDDDGPSAFVLHEGSKVRIMDRIGDWIQIRLEDGKVGWMPAVGVEEI